MAASPPTALQQTAALRSCRVDSEGEPLFGYLERLGFMKTAPSSGSNTRHRPAGCHFKGVTLHRATFRKGPRGRRCKCRTSTGLSIALTHLRPLLRRSQKSALRRKRKYSTSWPALRRPAESARSTAQALARRSCFPTGLARQPS